MSQLKLISSSGSITLQPEDGSGNIDITVPRGGLGGKFKQVQQSVKTDTTYVQSTSFTDVSGLSVSITPSATNSKILVVVHMQGTPDYYFAPGRLMRGSTEIAVPQSAGNRPPHALNATNHPSVHGEMQYPTVMYLDSPNTTSSVTYKVQVAARSDNASQGYFVNRSDVDRDAIHDGRGISTITVMEIGA